MSLTDLRADAVAQRGTRRSVTIAIDAMGGDHGARITVPAAANYLKKTPAATAILVGQQEVLHAEIARCGVTPDLAARLTVQHASQVVDMDEPPRDALRKKKDSSMRVAAALVKEGRAHAAVSAGNTGAWLATTHYVIKTLPGVDRPALCAPMPNQKDGATYVLDLGANVECEAENYYQFAIMGSALIAALENREGATVGLLNVGHEDIKGTPLVKAAGELLRAAHERGEIHFHGNVEGNDIFQGTVDLVVCDGFVGNVMLKASEGLGRMVKATLTQELKSSVINMAGALIAKRGLNAFAKRMSPSRYNGACLLGLKGIVIKSHGSADAFGFEYAISRAAEMAAGGVLERIAARLSTTQAS